jgi:hypothetical protein
MLPYDSSIENEPKRFIITLKNRFAAQHPWAHYFRRWPIIGGFYLRARAKYIEQELSK